MKLIQILLAVGIVALLLLLRFVLRRSAAVRAGFAVCLLAGLVLVFFPDITNVLAESVGVGRGVDLLGYFFALFSLGVFVLLYRKSRLLEQRLGSLVQDLAVSEARRVEEQE